MSEDGDDENLSDEGLSRGDLSMSIVEVPSQGMDLTLSLRGFGLSVVDMLPKELIYLGISEIEVNYVSQLEEQFNEEDRETIKTTKTYLLLKIGDLQIDNIINKEFPVLLGQMNLYKKRVVELSDENTPDPLSEYYRRVRNDQMVSKKYIKARHKRINKLKKEGKLVELQALEDQAKKEIPFILFELQMSQKQKEDRLGSIIRYDKIRFCMNKFFIAVESNIVKDNLNFVMGTLDIFSY